MVRRPAFRRVRPPWRGRRLTRARTHSTAALATVLILLTLFVVGSNLQTRRATINQQQALQVSRLLQTVRYDVAVEMLYARQYQLEPSLAVHQRHLDAADDVTAVLQQVRDQPGTSSGQDASSLLRLQATYREAADRMIAAVAVNDADSRTVDAQAVAPAYYTLQQQVDEITARYDQQAQAQVERLVRLQTTALVGTLIGFAVGLALMTIIYRTVLGYQRTLVATAVDSEHRALHDALTGLPNRACFASRLTSALAGRGAAATGLTAVLVIDLDGFKRVNDGLGHQAGDELLIEVGRRLQHLVRAGDTVARLGGDEFAVLLPEVSDQDAARAVAARAAQELRKEFIAGGHPVTIGGSIGIAIAPVHSSEVTIVQLADAAMYRAKTEMLGVAVYDAALDHRSSAELGLLQEVTALIDAGDPEGQLQLHYQPQVDLADLKVRTVEALLRWQHRDRGLVSPAEVLPLVQRAGLDSPLTALLLDRAVSQAAAWRAAGQHLQVAVNVSPTCLLKHGFAATVRATLQRHGLPGAALCLELVESAVLSEATRSAAVIADVRAIGVAVSLDDFGTGFSSLSHLRDLDLDEIKIDKTFVADLMTTGDDVVVRVAARLGQELRLRVVAEGVESTSILPALQAAGCTAVQGFALSRPVPAQDVLRACRHAEAAALPTPAAGIGRATPRRAADRQPGFTPVSAVAGNAPVGPLRST